MGYPRRESRGPTRPEDTERMRRVKYRYGLQLKRSGKGLQNLDKAMFEVRRHTEDAIVALRGRIEYVEALHINAGCRCEQAALKSQHRLAYLVGQDSGKTALEQASLMRDVVRYTNERNRHFARLRLTVDGLAADRQGGRADLYTRPLDVEETETAPFPPELSEPREAGRQGK